MPRRTEKGAAMNRRSSGEKKTEPKFDTTPRTRPEDLLEYYRPYFNMSDEERDRIRQALLEATMQMLGDKRPCDMWHPPEPPPEALELMRKWMRQYRERRRSEQDRRDRP